MIQAYDETWQFYIRQLTLTSRRPFVQPYPIIRSLYDFLKSTGDTPVLDIGCGNGIIGKLLIGQRKWNAAVMIDDSYLAIASTEMNLSESEGFKVIAQYNLDSFEKEQFDLVITNPPFHFEYEVDPSIAIQLMSDTHRILSNRGRLVIVANRHLNYKSQLSKYYSEVNIINENYKFIIYEALK